MEAAALWATAPNECEVKAAAVSPPGNGEVLVRTTWSGVSRGTESLVVRGAVPLSEYQRMRGPHMDGSFEFPVKYGYACVGVVEACPSMNFQAGERVFCLHPHQSRFVVAESAVRRIPTTTPSERAVLAPNMETAVNIAWDAAISCGDRVCVVGGGVIGLLVAYLAAKLTICRSVWLLDVQDRTAQCDALKIHLFDDNNDDLTDFDVVIHASGNPVGLARCLELAGDEATVVDASWYGDRACTIPLGHAFHSRRLTIKSSQVGRIPPHRTPRWDYQRRMNFALELCADPALDCLVESPDLLFPSSSADTASFVDAYCAALHGSQHADKWRTGLCYRIQYEH